MATTTQNDDDLIILTDEVQSDSSDEMVINLDSDDTETDEDIILTFDDWEDDTKEDNKIETIDSDNVILLNEDSFIINEEESKDNKPLDDLSNDMNIDFGSINLEDEVKWEDEKDSITFADNKDDINFDLWSFAETENLEENNINETVETLWEKTSNTESDIDLNLWNLDFSNTQSNSEETLINNEETKEDNKKESTITFEDDSITQEPETIESNIWTMESILDETIAKLSKRQDAIHFQEEEQVLAISHLEEEIKQLESEKKEAESKKSELSSEDKKIKTNITQLEKMKTATEVTDTKTKK